MSGRLVKLVTFFDQPIDPAFYTQLDPNGATAARPATPETGQFFFDTSLAIPIWWNGTAWVDATGGTV